MPAAQPLNVPLTPAKSQDNDKDKTSSQAKPNASAKAKAKAKADIVPHDISSPHELTAFVETLLTQLDAKFDTMSNQILDRMSQMSARVDALEGAIQDIINGDITTPQSPSPVPATSIRRSESGLQ
ncbi:hypothetical protein BDN72DRAFT_791209 [Pluteus cervinus]|uniref:Uncharacterized protein n=1 Tax=Pluteus cervinus TaxID=181527 RepID=A0ACD3B633_9AGAR|nr:hypothetical protein BDN72DRAFT_791209 [Pluteus cervinus]